MTNCGKPSEVIRNRIYVGQFPETTRELDLRKFFRGFGDIKEIMLMRGFAFVEFEEERWDPNSDGQNTDRIHCLIKKLNQLIIIYKRSVQDSSD